MRSSVLLRKFGWKSKGKKWIADNHSRPLTLSQAKNALARDLGARNFDKLKSTPKLSQAAQLVESGYQFTGSQFLPPNGKKPISFDKALERERKLAAKAARTLTKELGFKSEREREKVAAYYEKGDRFLDRFYMAYEANVGELDEVATATIQRLYYLSNRARTKRERETALNELLMFVGFRTGNEPYPAGQTPKSK